MALLPKKKMGVLKNIPVAGVIGHGYDDDRFALVRTYAIAVDGAATFGCNALFFDYLCYNVL